MATSLKEQAAKFEELKKANSPWLTLADGETATIVQLRSMKAGTEKDASTGIESAKMYFELDVDTVEGIKLKNLTTSSQKLIELFIENEIEIGSSFKLKRIGEKFDTRYEVSDVVNKPKGPSQPVSPASTPSATTAIPPTSQA